MTMPVYDTAFYDRADKSAVAARAIISILGSILEVGSVLDVGCARGTWLAAWRQAGCHEVFGIDGPFVTQDQLLIDPACFMTADLSVPFNLGRRFDIVQCLEVAEHLPRSRSASLVEDLVAHADTVIFSAAPPGQGGVGHGNERPYAFWQGLFAQHGYVACDYLRPALRGNEEVPYWYRYNMILYVKSDMVHQLHRPASACQSPPGAEIADISTISFRIRKIILRLLPPSVIDFLAHQVARLG